MRALKIKKRFFLSLLLLIVATATINAQKNSEEVDSRIDMSSYEAFMQGENAIKGFAAAKVSSLKKITQNPLNIRAEFNVKVNKSQFVLVELFDQYENLVEIIYSDVLEADKDYSFTVQRSKWDFYGNTHYFKVTTEEKTEKHEIKLAH